jgi:hypothetical protein
LKAGFRRESCATISLTKSITVFSYNEIKTVEVLEILQLSLGDLTNEFSNLNSQIDVRAIIGKFHGSDIFFFQYG